MIEVTQIRLKVDHSDSELKRALYRKLNLHINEELNWKVYRCSIDARKKGTSGVSLVYTIHINAGTEEEKILLHAKNKSIRIINEKFFNS